MKYYKANNPTAFGGISFRYIYYKYENGKWMLRRPDDETWLECACQNWLWLKDRITEVPVSEVFKDLL